MQNTSALQANRNPALSRNTGLSGAVQHDEIILGRGSSSPGHRKPNAHNSTPQRSAPADQPPHSPVCPIWVFALIGLLGIAGATLGILFGLGIIGPTNTQYQGHQETPTGTLVEGVYYHNYTVVVESVVVNGTKEQAAEGQEQGQGQQGQGQGQGGNQQGNGTKGQGGNVTDAQKGSNNDSNTVNTTSVSNQSQINQNWQPYNITPPQLPQQNQKITYDSTPTPQNSTSPSQDKPLVVSTFVEQVQQ